MVYMHMQPGQTRNKKYFENGFGEKENRVEKEKFIIFMWIYSNGWKISCMHVEQSTMNGEKLFFFLNQHEFVHFVFLKRFVANWRYQYSGENKKSNENNIIP